MVTRTAGNPLQTTNTTGNQAAQQLEQAPQVHPQAPAPEAPKPASTPERPRGTDRASPQAAKGRLAQDPAAQQQAAKLQGKLSATPTRAKDKEEIKLADPPQTHVKVDFMSQYAKGHGYTPGDTACFKAATAMAKDGGAKVLGADKRIEVAKGQNKDGTIKLNEAAAKEGKTYIDAQLDAGKPVVVGVSHKKGGPNVDGITDHFVTITGRGTDDKGKTYYTFMDPASTNAQRGSDLNPNNRFYVDDKGLMSREGKMGKGYVTDRHFEVAMVRRNAE